MAPNSADVPPSSLGYKPIPRRGFLKQTTDTWTEDKRQLDGAEGLWRIHDDLYDVTDFIKRHPGGAEWLEITKGTDITEAFEVHHLTPHPEEMLKKFLVRKAKTKRNSPFTFEEDGFYRTLKREAVKVLDTLPKQSARTSDFFIDTCMVSMFFFSILAANYGSLLFGTIAGMFLTFTTIAAHNYFHRKDNFRMYYFQFSGFNKREWRISHTLSHHLHTNTVIDMEISVYEPFLTYLPIEKKATIRYGSYLVAPLIWTTQYHVSLYKIIIQLMKGQQTFEIPDLVPFTIPLAMWLFSSNGLLHAILMWNYILFVGSFHFSIVGLHAAHHHPDIFHDGDTTRSGESWDWGFGQLDAVMDRREITGSHFLVLTNFGDHALHHMFPTLDHGVLEHLYPIVEEVAARFNVKVRMASQLDTFIGGYQSLSRVEPNPEPPNLLKKYY